MPDQVGSPPNATPAGSGLRSRIGHLMDDAVVAFRRERSGLSNADQGLFLDPDRLVRQVRAAEKGRDDGVENQPPVDQEVLTSFEAGVLEQGNEALSQMRRRTIQTLAGLNSVLMTIGIDPIGNELARIKNAALQEFSKIRNLIREPLIRLRRDELTAERYLRHFRAANDLARPANLKENKETARAIILVLIVFEGALNAVFFQELSDYGLVVGFAVALFVSIMNVGASFAFGLYILKNKNHVSKKVRQTTTALICMFSIFLLSFHTFVGYVRAYFETAPQNADSRIGPTFSDLLSAHVNFSLTSGVLVLVGLFFAAIAVADGYRYGDPYPGYAEVAKARNQASQAFDIARTRFINEAQSIIDRARHRIDEIVADAESRVQRYTEVAHDIEAALRLFHESATRMEASCDRVLKVYREANERVRTQYSPAYFQLHQAELDRDIGMDVADPTQRRNLMGEQVDELKEQAEKLKLELQAVLDAQQKDMDEFLENIDATASREVEKDIAEHEKASGLKL